MDNKGLLAIIAVLLISFFFILATEPEKGQKIGNLHAAANAADAGSDIALTTTASYDNP